MTPAVCGAATLFMALSYLNEKRFPIGRVLERPTSSHPRIQVLLFFDGVMTKLRDLMLLLLQTVVIEPQSSMGLSLSRLLSVISHPPLTSPCAVVQLHVFNNALRLGPSIKGWSYLASLTESRLFKDCLGFARPDSRSESASSRLGTRIGNEASSREHKAQRRLVQLRRAYC